MNRFLILSLTLALAPAATSAQDAPPPPIDHPTPSAQQRAIMEQLRPQFEQIRIQTRSRMLAALTPGHRAAVANIVGQLALSANPDPRAAAQALDAVLVPAEKQSVLTIEAARRANLRALRQQSRAAWESTLSADQRARLAQREAGRQAFRQNHAAGSWPGATDPGAILLRTLAEVGGPGEHGRPF